MEQERGEVDTGDGGATRRPHDLDRLLDQEVAVRLRARRAPTAVHLYPRNGPVLICWEGRRQADSVLRLDVVVGERQHDHQAIDVAEKVLERPAGAPAHHVRAGGTDWSAVVVKADNARIGQAAELRRPCRPDAYLLQRAVAREVRARCGSRAAR